MKPYDSVKFIWIKNSYPELHLFANGTTSLNKFRAWHKDDTTNKKILVIFL